MIIADHEALMDAIADRFFDEIHPFLGDGHPLWGPLAIALAASVKAGVSSAQPYVSLAEEINDA